MKLDKVQALWIRLQKVTGPLSDTPSFKVQITPNVNARSGNGAVSHYVDVTPGPVEGGAQRRWDEAVAICTELGAGWIPHENGIRVTP